MAADVGAAEAAPGVNLRSTPTKHWASEQVAFSGDEVDGLELNCSKRSEATRAAHASAV